MKMHMLIFFIYPSLWAEKRSDIIIMIGGKLPRKE